MNSTQFSSLLNDLNACQEARSWAEGKSLAVVWKTCKRADWLLWLVGKMAGKPNWPTRQQVVLAACACAETALKYTPKGEDRPRIAIETARKWANGEATLEEVRTARRNAAYAADAAAYAAATAATDYAAYAAADAAAYAAATAATTAYAADAANAATTATATAATDYAAYAAADAAAYAAYAASRTKTLAKLAGIVRKEIKLSLLARKPRG